MSFFADPVTRFEVGDLGGGFIEICQQRRKNIMLAAVLATTVLIVTMAIVVAIAVLLSGGNEHDTHTGKDSKLILQMEVTELITYFIFHQTIG